MPKVEVELPTSFTTDLEKIISDTLTSTMANLKHNNDYPDYLKIDQAAKFLGVSRNTLTQKFIPAGLPVITIQGLQRIAKKSAIKFMQDNEI